MVPALAHADLLGTTTFSAAVGRNRVAPHTVRLLVSYIDLQTLEFSEGLFDHLEIDVSDIGTTLSATAATDPDFGLIADGLTNGIAENMAIRIDNSIGELSARFRLEEQWFGLAQADFIGFEIEEITFRVDDFTIQEPAPGTRITLTGLLSIYGTAGVPVETVSWGAIKALYSMDGSE
jgi:hypothetical protein